MSGRPTLRARISRGALGANARRAMLDAGADPIADLRRDAWGHGVGVVAEVLADTGVAFAVVDDPGGDAAVAAGLEAVTESVPTLPGALLFGLPGSGGVPVMRLSGTVMSTKRLLAGEGVSYGHTHVAATDTRLALVRGGYAQGIMRSLGNRVFVEVGGARHPIIGRVAMDVCVVDIGDAAISAGDEAVFFGGDGAARGALAEWERASGLTAAELVCAIGLHVPREMGA